MRKNMYRGKNKDNKKWVYGYFVKGVKDDETYIITNHNWLLGDDFIEVIPETVGQYVEQDDIEDNPIYEGDIIQYESKLYIVFFAKDLGFKMKPLKDLYDEEYCGYYIPKKVKRIGNIYDNFNLYQSVIEQKLKTDSTNNQRIVQVLRKNKWVTIPFSQLKKGDTFRMYESNGEPVIDPNNGNPRTEFLAVSELYKDSETGEWCIDIKSECGDIWIIK
jgi:hypothetical protein